MATLFALPGSLLGQLVICGYIKPYGYMTGLKVCISTDWEEQINTFRPCLPPVFPISRLDKLLRRSINIRYLKSRRFLNNINYCLLVSLEEDDELQSTISNYT